MADYRIIHLPDNEDRSIFEERARHWPSSALRERKDGLFKREYLAQRAVKGFFGAKWWWTIAMCRDEKEAEDAVRKQAIKDGGGKVVAEFERTSFNV